MQGSGHSEMPSLPQLSSSDLEALDVTAATADEKHYLDISSLNAWQQHGFATS